MAQILAERARSGELIVLQTGGERISWHSFGYYYHERAVYDLERPGAPPRPAGTSWTTMMPITGAPQRLTVPETTTGAWVMLTSPENLTKPARAALYDLRRRFPRAEELPLRRGRLLHLRR